MATQFCMKYYLHEDIYEIINVSHYLDYYYLSNVH